MKHWLILLIFSCCFFSCKNKSLPDGVLKQEQMESILWDLMRAQSYTSTFIKKDSSVNAASENLRLQKQIFFMHHVSREDFYKSYDYYRSRPDLLEIMLDSVNALGERERDSQFRKPNNNINKQFPLHK